MIIVITTIIITFFLIFLYHRISNALKLPNMLSPYKIRTVLSVRYLNVALRYRSCVDV